MSNYRSIENCNMLKSKVWDNCDWHLCGLTVDSEAFTKFVEYGEEGNFFLPVLTVLCCMFIQLCQNQDLSHGKEEVKSKASS